MRKDSAKSSSKSGFRFEMGDTVRDVLSGLRGVVTGRCEHMVGLSQFLVQRRGEAQGHWLDEVRLEPVPGRRRAKLKFVVRVAPNRKQPPR